MLSADRDARLKEQKPLTLENNPGREFVIEVPGKGTLVAHVYGLRLGGGNVYLALMAAGPDYGPASPPVVKFFESLRLEHESPADVAKQLATAPPGRKLELIADLKKRGPAAREALPTLTEIVKDTRDYMACMAAADVLGDLGPAAAPAAPALTAVLRANEVRKPGPDNGNLRLHLAAALVRIDPKDALARKILRDCTKDPNASVRVAALAGLVRLDPAGNAADLDEILGVWQHGTWERDDAARALKQLGPLAAKAVPVLTKALRGKLDPLRRSAVDVLGGLGPTARGALPALRALDAPPTPEDLRLAVREACKKIEAAGG
jgi:hypothetical protein